jgi:hypothetical protein
LAETPWWNADPDANREPALGIRDHVARVTWHSAFLVRSPPRSHGHSVLSSRLGLRLGEVMFDPCAVAFASPPTSARSNSSSRSRLIDQPRTSRRVGTWRRPTRSRSSATTRRPASAAWTCCVGGWCRSGRRTSKSASPTSTPRPKGSRGSRRSARHSSGGAASYRPIISTNGRRSRLGSSPIRSRWLIGG